MVYVLCAITSCVLSGVGMHLAIGLRPDRLTLPSFLWLTYHVVVLAPVTLIAVQEERPETPLVFTACALAPFCFLLGMRAASLLFGFERGAVEQFYRSPIEPFQVGDVSALQILFAVALGVTCLCFAELQTIPLLYALRNIADHVMMVDLREEATVFNDSGFRYLYFVLRQFGWSFVIVTAFGAALRRASSPRFWCFFLATASIGVVYNAAVLIKSSIAALFIGLCMYFYLSRRGRIGVAFYACSLLLILALPVSVLWLHAPDRGIPDILASIAERLLYTPASLIYVYFDLALHDIGFQYGQTTGRYVQIMRYFDPTLQHFPISEYAFAVIHPYTRRLGHSPAPFIGYAFVDWGLSGVLVYATVAAFVAQSIQIWLLKRRKNVVIVAAYALSFYSFFELNRAALPTVMLSYGALFIPLLAVTFLWLSDAIHQRRRAGVTFLLHERS